MGPEAAAQCKVVAASTGICSCLSHVPGLVHGVGAFRHHHRMRADGPQSIPDHAHARAVVQGLGIRLQPLGQLGLGTVHLHTGLEQSIQLAGTYKMLCLGFRAWELCR